MEAERRTIDHLEKWRAYAADRSIERRNELVMLHADLVTGAALKMIKRLPPTVTECELASAGMDGLIDAVEKYDVERGLRFQTYSAWRIFGAINDYLRTIDDVPRLVRRHEARVDLVRGRLAQLLGHQPTLEDVERAIELADLSAEQLAAAQQIPASTSLSLVVARTDSEREILLGQELRDRKQLEPREPALAREEVWRVLKGLNKQERILMLGYYFHDQTMREIGRELGLSESRVSQLHSAILDRLQKQERRRSA